MLFRYLHVACEIHAFWGGKGGEGGASRGLVRHDSELWKQRAGVRVCATYRIRRGVESLRDTPEIGTGSVHAGHGCAVYRSVSESKLANITAVMFT